MKISIFVMTILCLSLNSLSAQHTTNIATAQSTLDQAFSYIDDFDTPSGILYGQSKHTVLLEYYNDYLESDSIFHNQFTHNLIAKSLYENRTDFNSWMTNPENDFISLMNQTSNINDTAVILINSIEYHTFSDQAGNNGDIYEDNGVIKLSNGKTLSDVIENDIAASATFQNTKVVGPMVTFQYDTSNVFGNKPIQSVEIKVENQPFSVLGSTFSYNFSSLGKQTIILKITNVDNETFYIYHTIELVSSASLKDNSSTNRNPFDGDFNCNVVGFPDIDCETFDNENIQGSVVLSCNGENQWEDIRKPLIILDGIDLTWNRNEVDNEAFFLSPIYSRFNRAGFEGGTTTLEDFLDANNYDLIFVDYRDLHRSIEENALAVQELLRDINQNMEINGSTEPIRELFNAQCVLDL